MKNEGNFCAARGAEVCLGLGRLCVSPASARLMGSGREAGYTKWPGVAPPRCLFFSGADPGHVDGGQSLCVSLTLASCRTFYSARSRPSEGEGEKGLSKF